MTRVQHASAEGRLTLAETEERIGAVYAAKYLDELETVTADLPAERPATGRFTPRLRIHAAIVVVLSALLVVRWVASGVPFFWPIVPIFWLGLESRRARRVPVTSPSCAILRACATTRTDFFTGSGLRLP